MQQILDRAVYVGHGKCRSGCATDWKSGDTKAESTRPRSPGEVVQLLLQHGIGGVWIDSHFKRDLSFFVRIADRVLHPAAVARVIVPALPDILNALLGASQKLHESLRNIGNRLRWIFGDVFCRVERAFGRSKK